MNYETFLELARGLAKDRAVAIRVETVDGESPQGHVSTSGWFNLPPPQRDNASGMYREGGRLGVVLQSSSTRAGWRCAARIDTFHEWWPSDAVRDRHSEVQLVASVYECANEHAITLPKQIVLDTKRAPLLLRVPLEMLAA